ncbi:HAD-IA family hydrolase [Actinophytocola sp. NPDC049390]|uniref:HAD-IA family hydrolase n=1 Tax=Actinophytocola sp. NPDC049390 TaxID=3363894 RepID=UPI0037AB501B
MTFDAVLCDLDGVLRQWPDTADLEREHGVRPGTLAAAAFAPHRLLPAITGQCTDEAWRAAIADDLRTHTATAAELVAAWSRGTGSVDEEVAAVLALAGAPVVLVTNATTRLESDVDVLGLGRHVDGIVNSARIGVAKPDPGIYLAAAKEAGAPPQRCLFVDDDAANVAAAEALGMTGHHFTGVVGLRAVLTRNPPRTGPSQ